MNKLGAVSSPADPTSDGSDWETNSSLESSLDEEETRRQKNEQSTKSSKKIQKTGISTGNEVNSTPLKSSGTSKLGDAAKVAASVGTNKMETPNAHSNVKAEDPKEVVEVKNIAKENVDGKTNKISKEDPCFKTTQEMNDVLKTNPDHKVEPAPDSDSPITLPNAIEKRNDLETPKETKSPEGLGVIDNGEVPKQGVVKKIIKVKKKKLKPKIDVIETPQNVVIDSTVAVAEEETSQISPPPLTIFPGKKAPCNDDTSRPSTVDRIPTFGSVDADPPPVTSRPEKTSIEESRLTTNSAELQKPSVDTKEQVNNTKDSCRDDKIDDSSVISRSLESLEDSTGAKEPVSEADAFSQKLEAEVLEFLSKRKMFDGIKEDSDNIRDSPPREFKYKAKYFEQEANDDDDDIIENITKYLNKKLSRGDVDPPTSTAHELENDFEDSDSEHLSKRNILHSKTTNQREAARGRGEAFMDQVRRERTVKSSRQRRNSLYQPRRRWETDERVAEKTKQVRALIEKQVAVVENMGTTVQKFAELEVLVRELKAESLEQRAELSNLEDLFDIVYSKYKNEISAAAEALRMQKRGKREKVNSKSEVNSMLQEFFSPHKQTSGGHNVPESDEANAKFTKPSIDFSFGKDGSRDNLKGKHFELIYPEHKSSANPDATGFSFLAFAGDKYLTKTKSGELDRQTEAVKNDQADLTSLSAAEFIERIRNKYAISSPKVDQKATISNSHRRGGSFLHKFSFSPINDDLPSDDSTFGFRKFSSRKTSTGTEERRREFENPFTLDEFKVKKVRLPEQVAHMVFASSLQTIKH